MNHIQCYSVRVSRHTAVTNLIVTRAVSAIAELLVTVSSNAKIEWAYVPDANVTDCLLQTTANRNVDDSERRQSLISSLFWPTTLVLGYVLAKRWPTLLLAPLSRNFGRWCNAMVQFLGTVLGRWQTDRTFLIWRLCGVLVGTPSRQDRQRRDENQRQSCQDSDSTCTQYCRRSALYKLLCMYVCMATRTCWQSVDRHCCLHIRQNNFGRWRNAGPNPWSSAGKQLDQTFLIWRRYGVLVG